MRWGVHSVKIWQDDWPDLVFFYPGGERHIFMELKREGEVPRPSQTIKINMLRAHGQTVYWSDNEQEALAFIEENL